MSLEDIKYDGPIIHPNKTEHDYETENNEVIELFVDVLKTWKKTNKGITYENYLSHSKANNEEGIWFSILGSVEECGLSLRQVKYCFEQVEKPEKSLD